MGYYGAPPLDPTVEENAETIVKLTAAADAHLAAIDEAGRAKSLYLSQAVRVMPCCPRGSGGGVLHGEVEKMPAPGLDMPWVSAYAPVC